MTIERLGSVSDFFCLNDEVDDGSGLCEGFLDLISFWFDDEDEKMRERENRSIVREERDGQREEKKKIFFLFNYCV